MRGLNLDHLRMFAQVAELGSFSAAAERNGVTQPAVSLQVRQLERRYGLKLVERVGRRARPTAAGLELLTHIRAIDATLAQAEQAMTAHASQVSGRLRLGTGATACTCCRRCWRTCGGASRRWRLWPARAIRPTCCAGWRTTRWISAW